MNILTCAPRDYACNKEECCVCGREINIIDSCHYEVTISGLTVCSDCLDRLVREHQKKNN